MKKFCTKCGKPFEAVGREVICPACKAQAAEDAKRAAVMKAKRASWAGESVPVRISGRASTVIREYGAANNMPFAQALDELLKETTFVKGMAEKGVAWNDITPYKSHRRDKHATETEDAPQEVKQDKQEDKPVKPVKPVKQATKQAGKATTSTTSKATKAKA